MASLSARIAGIAAAGCGLIALAAVYASPPPPGTVNRTATASLCTTGETPLFACPIGTRQVAVCARNGGAVYRFGRLDRIEMDSGDLTMAMHGFAGGGETQITAAGKGYSYTVFDQTTRTAFGNNGRHDAAATSGLIVRRGGRTIQIRNCNRNASIASRADGIVKPGSFVPH